MNAFVDLCCWSVCMSAFYYTQTIYLKKKTQINSCAITGTAVYLVWGKSCILLYVGMTSWSPSNLNYFLMLWFISKYNSVDLHFNEQFASKHVSLNCTLSVHSLDRIWLNSLSECTEIEYLDAFPPSPLKLLILAIESPMSI